MNDSIKPLVRHHELIVQELHGELLVYDLAAHKAYCLNQSAAMVWNLCDGNSTVADMAAHLATRLNTGRDEEVVRFALEELAECKLLQTPIKGAAGEGQITRRELTRRVGIAAASLPLIIALNAPTAAQSASRLLPNGASCTLSADCASGCCDANQCEDISVCST